MGNSSARHNFLPRNAYMRNDGIVFFAYFDESGDSGYAGSPTPSFTLAAILVREEDWRSTLEGIISLRRFLKKHFQIKIREELKANKLVKSKGPFAHLSPDATKQVYAACMRFQAKCGTIKTFAVVIDKGNVQFPGRVDPRDKAWDYALQRVQTWGTKNDGNALLLPDDGHEFFIRKKLRKMRRIHHVPSAFGTGSLSRPATNILEDPNNRRSHESQFIQLADLNAYAAYRKAFPIAKFDGAMWDKLGGARETQVNAIRGGPEAIVRWP